MGETTFTFRVDEELKEAFAKVAKDEDRTAAQLIRGFMRDLVEKRSEAQDYDAWFRAEVEQGLRELDDPNTELIPHETVMARLESRLEELRKRGGD